VLRGGLGRVEGVEGLFSLTGVSMGGVLKREWLKGHEIMFKGRLWEGCGFRSIVSMSPEKGV